MYPAFRQIITELLWLKPIRQVLINQQTRIFTQKPENVKLPPTPDPCCLAGCTNCVWVEYANKIADLMQGYDDKSRETILNRVPDPVLRSFLKVELKSILQQKDSEKNMRPPFRQPCTRGLLIQPAKTLLNNLLRIYGDKSSDIEIPPEPTTCCMSGCANCVWIEYAETLSKLFEGNDVKAREIILSKITDPNLKMFLSMELKTISQKKNTEKTIASTSKGDK